MTPHLRNLRMELCCDNLQSYADHKRPPLTRLLGSTEQHEVVQRHENSAQSQYGHRACHFCTHGATMNAAPLAVLAQTLK